MLEEPRFPKWRATTLEVICLVVAIIAVIRSAAVDIEDLQWLVAAKTSALMLVVAIASFGLLATKGWLKHRRLGVPLAAFLGIAAIALGSLLCGTGCSGNCGNREASIVLSFAGGIVLAAAVAENANLVRAQSDRRPQRKGRRR